MTGLVEDSAEAATGDSGGPYFIPHGFAETNFGEATIQGICIGKGSNYVELEGTLTANSDMITGLPEEMTVHGEDVTVEQYIEGLKTQWKGSKTGVPIVAEGFVPGDTMVESVTINKTSHTTEIKMSRNAEQAGTLEILFGRTSLSWYEPMAEVLKQFKDQQLLTTANETRG
jgi:hypothetical protein